MVQTNQHNNIMVSPGRQFLALCRLQSGSPRGVIMYGGTNARLCVKGSNLWQRQAEESIGDME